VTRHPTTFGFDQRVQGSNFLPAYEGNGYRSPCALPSIIYIGEIVMIIMSLGTGIGFLIGYFGYRRGESRNGNIESFWKFLGATFSGLLGAFIGIMVGFIAACIIGNIVTMYLPENQPDEVVPLMSISNSENSFYLYSDDKEYQYITRPDSDSDNAEVTSIRKSHSVIRTTAGIPYVNIYHSRFKYEWLIFISMTTADDNKCIFYIPENSIKDGRIYTVG
jgi:hypothetical protein